MIIDIDINKIKFLYIKKEDLILALDRLTRFKYPEISYYRVFSEIICKYLIHPHITKNQIKELDTNTLKSIIEKIWNESVNYYSPDAEQDKKLNEIIIDEINNTYNLSKDIQTLVNTELNINTVLDFIPEDKEQPINLKRLNYIKNNPDNLIKQREKYALRFPVEKVVLCEGITEEILLPKFAQLSGYDFDKNGIKLISAGGKNQVAKIYCELKDELKIPIFILLDADASATSDIIKNVLRNQDCIYLIKHGEFEDISPIITKLKNGKTKIELNNIETSPDGYKNILICDKNGKFEKRVAFLTEPDSGAKGYITCNYMVGEPNYKKYKSVFKLDADNNGTPGSMTFIVNENSSTGKRTTGVILKQNNNEGVIRVHTQVDTDTLSNLIIDTGLFDENHKVKFINRTITNDPDNPCSECIKFEPKHKPIKFNIEEIEKYYDNETIDKLQNFQEKHLDKVMSMLDSINAQ